MLIMMLISRRTLDVVIKALCPADLALSSCEYFILIFLEEHDYLRQLTVRIAWLVCRIQAGYSHANSVIFLPDYWGESGQTGPASIRTRRISILV